MAADAIITQGVHPSDSIMEPLLPETKAILTTLVTLPRNHFPLVFTKVSSEAFQSCYRAMPEYTSSSPSGRHIGHYKAISTSDYLSSLFAAMMSIPLMTGFSPQ
jgi:hypothetical protein